MTCQGRNPRYFNEEEQADMVDDILNALEYALGPAESEWGGMRARMGHEKPFRLDYPCDPWSMRFLEVSRWILSEGKSWIARDSFPPRPISDIKTVHLKKNDFNHLKYTVSGHCVTLEVNGETIDTAELPAYPAMGTVATDDDEQVIVKIVNFAESDEPVEITLDCDVEEDYTVDLLTGNATDENSIEKPENVHDVSFRASGASSAFTYEAPALSVNILKLTKK